jgi:hypothetical protein
MRPAGRELFSKQISHQRGGVTGRDKENKDWGGLVQSNQVEQTATLEINAMQVENEQAGALNSLDGEAVDVQPDESNGLYLICILARVMERPNG